MEQQPSPTNNVATGRHAQPEAQVTQEQEQESDQESVQLSYLKLEVLCVGSVSLVHNLSLFSSFLLYLTNWSSILIYLINEGNSHYEYEGMKFTKGQVICLVVLLLIGVLLAGHATQIDISLRDSTSVN